MSDDELNLSMAKDPSAYLSDNAGLDERARLRGRIYAMFDDVGFGSMVGFHTANDLIDLIREVCGVAPLPKQAVKELPPYKA